MGKFFIGVFLFFFFSFPTVVLLKAIVEKEEIAECQQWQQQLLKPHRLADWQKEQCEQYGIKLQKKGSRL